MNNLRLSNPTRYLRPASWIVPPLLLFALSAPLQAQFNYIITNGTVTITGYNCASVGVSIPSTIAGLPVTSIGEAAFANCSSLIEVVIPNSVISIGDYAFDGCRSLTSVTIPNSVRSIGHDAFDLCSGLRNVTLGNSVTPGSG